MMKYRMVIGTLALLIGVALCSQAIIAKDTNLRMTGAVVGISGRSAGRSSPFELIVNNYTSPAQVRELSAALQTGGQDNLMSTLSHMKAGRIQIGSGVGVDAN